MLIRNTREQDLPRLLEIYEQARAFMARTGNPRQWGQSHWPPEEVLREDIRLGRGYVVVDSDGEAAKQDDPASQKEKIVAAFVYIYGKDIDPTYRIIEEGGWQKDAPYGVIHRLAADGSRHGVAETVFDWAMQKAGYLRVDTHPDNSVMQAILQKNGFTYAGIIHVTEDNDPRLAYEKA